MVQPANQRGSRVGLIIVSPKKITIEKSLRLGFTTTNNEAEYEALLEGMAMVQKVGKKTVEMFSNSELIVGQVKGELEARDVRMQEYLGQVRCLQSWFDSFKLSHIPRSGNTHADSLATLATSSAQDLPRVILVEDLCKPAVKNDVVQIHQISIGSNWMDPIVLFLKNDILHEEKLKAEKVRKKAPWFWLSEDLNCTSIPSLGHIYYVYISRHQNYYQKSYMKEFVKVTREEDLYLTEPLLRDIGGRICKMRYKSHFPKAARTKRYLLVSTDYFTKWVEAEPLANIKDVDAKKFVWRNIVTRFGVPHTLISDNGLQFDNKAFKWYCCDMKITNRYSTPTYPQRNGQVKAANKVIVNELKKRLDDAKEKWVEELSHVL
nr:uncharacterized protein LOC111984835 [Quercus suber]